MAANPTLDTSAVDTAVDNASISPTREREEFLSKRLANRPDAQDLKNRNILRDTTAAPALQSAQQELERQKITDNLKKGLERRSDREILVERNILPDSSAAPALQAHQKELERHMRRDSLDKHLHNRPKPEDLIEKGILASEFALSFGITSDRRLILSNS